MVSTSLDSQDELANNYRNAIKNVRKLEQMGCLVLFGIDATNMSQHFFLKTQTFDRIVFNFPHIGFLFREDNFCQIRMNEELVQGFLREAKVMVRQEGEIHITHKEGHPYNQWDLEANGSKIGLVSGEVIPFFRRNFPGYENKRGDWIFGDQPFPLGACSTYKFKLLRPLPGCH